MDKYVSKSNCVSIGITSSTDNAIISVFHISVYICRQSTFRFIYVFSPLSTYKKEVDPSEFVNTFLASGDFCYLLITFANSLERDQDRQKVGPDLDLNRLTL